MAESVLDVIIDPRKAQSGARAVQTALTSMGNRATQVTNHLKNRFDGVRSAVFSLQTAIAALGVVSFGRSLLHVADQLDKAERGLRTVTTSAGQAAVQLERIRKIEDEFQFGDLPMANAFRLLVSNGIPDAEQALRTLGNVALSTGEDIESVVTAMIAGNERALRRLGVQLIDLGQGEVDLVFGNMEIRAQKTDQAIRRGLLQLFERGFPDATKELGNSVDFQLKRVKDGFEDLQVAILRGGLNDFLASTFKTIADGLDPNEINRKGEAIAAGIKKVVQTITRDIAVAIDLLTPFGKAALNILNAALDGFNRLPPELQTLGIFGALWFGKRGLVVLTAGLALAEKLNITMADAVREAGKFGAGLADMAKNTPLGKLLERGVELVGPETKKAVEDTLAKGTRETKAFFGIDDAATAETKSALATLNDFWARVEKQEAAERKKRLAAEKKAEAERQAGASGLVAGGRSDQDRIIDAQLAQLREQTDLFVRQERQKQTAFFDPERAEALNKALSFTNTLQEKGLFTTIRAKGINEQLLHLWEQGVVPTDEIAKNIGMQFLRISDAARETRQFNAQLEISRNLTEETARLQSETRDISGGTRGQQVGAFPGAFGTEQPSRETILDRIGAQMKRQGLAFDRINAAKEVDTLLEARRANFIARTTYEMDTQIRSQKILTTAVGSHVDEREAQIRALMEIQALQQKGVVLDKEEIANIHKKSRAVQEGAARLRNVDAVNQFVDTFRVGFDTIVRSGEQAYAHLEDALVQMINKGKIDFRQFGDFVQQEMTRLSIRLVLQKLMGAGGGGGFLDMLGGFGGGGSGGGIGNTFQGIWGIFSKFFGLFKGAGFGAAGGGGIPSDVMIGQRGGRFGYEGKIRGYQWGGIPSYEQGGVSHNERLIKISEGQTPEAIVPLRGGKIPVQMKGGGTTINAPITIITPDAAGVRRSDTQIQAQMSTALVRASRRIN